MKRLLRTLTVNGLQLFPPEKVLRWLFRIDRWLYYFEGQMARAYGQGVHPKHRHIRYHDFFIARLTADERVLDIGCGIGAVAHDVAERAAVDVVAVDINSENIAAAQKRFAHPRVQYMVGDALQILPEGRFDAVILSNVLEHLPQRPLFLRNVQKAVQPDRILIRVPLFERDWRVPLKKELGVEWRLDPTHETEYTLDSFAQEMEESGLEVTYMVVKWGEIWAECKQVET